MVLLICDIYNHLSKHGHRFPSVCPQFDPGRLKSGGWKQIPLLQGLSHVICYIDDILVTGVSEEEHLHNLEEILKRLQQHGIRVNTEKCAFCQDTVEFLGHSIDQRGTPYYF